MAAAADERNGRNGCPGIRHREFPVLRTAGPMAGIHYKTGGSRPAADDERSAQHVDRRRTVPRPVRRRKCGSRRTDKRAERPDVHHDRRAADRHGERPGAHRHPAPGPARRRERPAVPERLLDDCRGFRTVPRTIPHGGFSGRYGWHRLSCGPLLERGRISRQVFECRPKSRERSSRRPAGGHGGARKASGGNGLQ